MVMLTKKYRAFVVQKDGNPADFCEDAFEVKETTTLLRCAVADGATDSFFSGFWAKLLVSSYCIGDLTNGNYNRSIDELQAIWMEKVAQMSLPWYAEEKSKSGAFAAIVGLSIHLGSDSDLCRETSQVSKNESEFLQISSCFPSSVISVPMGSLPFADRSLMDGVVILPGRPIQRQEHHDHLHEARKNDGRKWEAFALGDSCLFQYRNGRLLNSMPLSTSAEFSSCPYLISSRQENNKNLAELFVRQEGTWEPGDQFLLMSDAIACWLLQQEENGESPLRELNGIRDEDEFRAWVSELRNTKGKDGKPLLKNDDVTILHLSLPEEVL